MAVLTVARLPGTVAGAQASGPSGPAWHPAPAHLALLTPSRHRDAYSAFASPEPLERALEDALASVPPGVAPLRGPGRWVSRRIAGADAFGTGSAYDRWQLVRLYGARGPRVARGAIVRDDGPVEMWTFVSPYPDAALGRLEAGTLLLVLRLP